MSSRVLVAALVLFTNASGLLAQETLFSGENAYNPVPNPGGSKVAYVLTGRGRVGGTGGFGRSNMKSFLAFSSPDGRPISSVLIEGFLDRWLDENSLSFYRDWHFGIATDSGSQLTGSRTIDLNTGPIPSERVTYMATLKKFVWLDE